MTTDITKKLNNAGNSLTKPHIENWSTTHSTCDVDGCGEKTEQAIAVVKKGGRRLIGTFSDFGRWKTVNGEIVELTLFPQYEWVGWISRCTGCYSRERVNHSEIIKIPA